MNETMGRLSGRIALITGASRGIGRAVALRMAQEGAHVILVARTVGGLEEVDDEIQNASGSATLVQMDLREHEKIDQLGAQIAARYGKLDILVGNAAMLGELTPLTHMEAGLWNDVLSVNLTANWRLIRICDPLLRKSEGGRAMFVTSGVVRSSHPFWGAYATSKAGLEMLVKTYAAEVASTPVRVNLIDPGIVRTNMRAKAMPGENPETVPLPETVTETFIRLAETSCTKNGEVRHSQTY